MSTPTPSPRFEEAAAYLSSAPSLSKVSDTVKLELYGLFKFITTSHSPNSSRPSIFNITGRAKWDAWKQTETTYGDRDGNAEERYLQLARELGWIEGSVQSATQSSTSAVPPATKPGDDDEDIWDDEETTKRHQGSSASMGNTHVSTITEHEEAERIAGTLHEYAVTGDIHGLQAFLQSHPTTDLNEKDEYGYTPLHLASDRGHLPIVELLLAKGVDSTIKDQDEFTAVELARVSEHDDIVAVLEKAAG
ncbi:acyl CoA binding protein-domain-containing protein [Cristinia sonorae]|uniref:Acyl CoA binding protein-domain-containing protein n=1 Tax=Cristinia sonorae TaxID=1940300 RepID=A0A8K0UTX8_9AGAR|nr:acyl CoA binding protein-domain-containing protein [Cristinia sonorae]